MICSSIVGSSTIMPMLSFHQLFVNQGSHTYEPFIHYSHGGVFGASNYNGSYASTNSQAYYTSGSTETSYSSLPQQMPLNLYISLLSEMITFKTTNTLNSPLPNESWPRSPLPLLRDFVLQLVIISQSLPITLLVVMVLLDRLRVSLPNQAIGSYETGHRVFLAAIIVANKFLLDIPVKNSVWSQWTSNYYSTTEINCMERQFLNLLHYDIEVSMPEVQTQLTMIHRAHSTGLRYRCMPLVNSSHPLVNHQSSNTGSNNQLHFNSIKAGEPLGGCYRKRVHHNRGDEFALPTQSAVPPNVAKNHLAVKKQKNHLYDQSSSWHSILSPSLSLDRSPAHLVYPSTAHSSIWNAYQPPCFRQVSFV